MLNRPINVAILFAAAVFAAKPACALYADSQAVDFNMAGTVSHAKAKLPAQLSMGPDPGGKTGETLTPGTTEKPAAQAPGASTPSAGSKPNQGSAPTGNAESSNPQRDSAEKPPAAAGTAVTPPASPGTPNQPGNR